MLRGLAEWGKLQNDVAEVFDVVVHIAHFGSV
jgi:hypothetical protein